MHLSYSTVTRPVDPKSIFSSSSYSLKLMERRRPTIQVHGCLVAHRWRFLRHQFLLRPLPLLLQWEYTIAAGPGGRPLALLSVILSRLGDSKRQS